MENAHHETRRGAEAQRKLLACILDEVTLPDEIAEAIKMFLAE